MRKVVAITVNCLFICSSLFAQTNSETGCQPVINYSPKEYNAEFQNWAAVQRKNGIMYFGNSDGLLEFDGSNWRLYPLPDKYPVRSLANGDSEKIYVGAIGDLGYFQPDSSGRLIFHSLVNFIPNDKRDFADVWNTFAGNDKVYFQTHSYIFIWDIQKKTFKIFESKNGFHFAFMVNGRLYVREFEKGLKVLNADLLISLKGGEKFADEGIYGMLPFPGKAGTILIVTRTMGLFKYDGNNFIPFKTTADKFINENRPYLPGTILSDGNILIGTLHAGAVVIDTSGKEVRMYNTGNGIINNSINYSFQDMAGGVWLLTSNGVSRISYSSPLSYFDSRNNFSTICNDIIRHNGTIYIAADDGVHYLDSATSSFQLLKNSSAQSWSFAETGNELLVGVNDGLFKVEKDSLSPIRKSIGYEYHVTILKRSKLNPNRIYVGTREGLRSILKSGSSWADEGQFLNTESDVSDLKEDSDGRLWVGTISSGLFRVTLQRDSKGNVILNKPLIEHFDRSNGLQDGIVIIKGSNRLNYFLTPDSLYRFDERKKLFYSDTSDRISSAFYHLNANNSVYAFEQDYLGRIWMSNKNKLIMGKPRTDGSYDWISAPFNGFADETVTKVYAEKDGIVWFGTTSPIIKYTIANRNPESAAFSALVREVQTGKDSTIYFGEETGTSMIPQVSYKNNSLKFRYAATSYEGRNTNRFKTFLQGFDDDWSPLSTENTKEYTNLPPGKYTFKIGAENIFEKESKTAFYSFEILPPWYRTWWAYVCYALLAGVSIFYTDRWRRKRVIAKERERSEFREAKLKAEAENEKRKNIELISEMGKDITASLSAEHIIETVYGHVNSLMDASVFGIGMLNADQNRLDFPATKEKGTTLPSYSYKLNDKNRAATWCFNNKEEIFINDFEKEHQLFIEYMPEAAQGENAKSVIYLPLIYKEKSIGVITAQSFNKNAYNDYHLNILRSLATYTAVALDNADAYRRLKSTQAQLIQSEKMASLGELTAGIAHEIQNPLNFVNNFSDVNKELLEELKDEADKGNIDEVKAIADDVINNEQKINHHGKRADAIVKGMLQHSRAGTGVKEPTDINKLAGEYLRLSYHGMKARDKSFNAEMKTDFDESLSADEAGIGKINVVPQDIGRVLLNLFNNAFYAVNDKKRTAGVAYQPTISIVTKRINPPLGAGSIEIRVSDNGNGIPQNIVDKIFQPFFTTKPTGEGTGLGLSLAYDIIKAHGGEIKVEAKEKEGSEFVIHLPPD